MNETHETLQEFTERMSKVDKLREYVIGRAYQGNSRTVFRFVGQYCYLESSGFSIYHKPKTVESKQLPPIVQAILMTAKIPCAYWWTDYMSYGIDRAKVIARHYHATISEAPYAEESNKWFHYCFDTFEDLMRFVYDRHTGVFVEKWGKETVGYVNCFGDRTPQDVNAIEQE